jgi:citrate synthase
VWRSAICKSNEDTVVVRVADLSEDLIVHLNFGDYFYLLLTGKRADTGLI